MTGAHHRCADAGVRAADPPANLVGVLTPPPTDHPATTRISSDNVETPLPLVVRVTDADAVTVASPPRAKSSATDPLAHRFGAVVSGEQDFAGRYHIIRRIGVGGMGAVYQAWDGKLGISVALKVIRPEITASPAEAAELERRFKRELLLARQVTHANVIRIHDLGEVEGTIYITMPYVEGADLATILQQGKLTVPRALHLARQIAAGLAAAHEAGVVHRDLKPGNVMVDAADHAFLMDFGIARSTTQTSRGSSSDGVTTRLKADASDATSVGTIVGTLQYMAPEQARGEHVDHRADIYAFGLIVYEMLLGCRSLSDTAGALADLQQRMLAAPPGVSSVDSGVPATVERILDRCLAPDPAARYQATADLLADLNALDADGHPLPVPRRLTRRIVAAAAALVIGLTGGTWWVAKTRVPPPPPPPVTVLVADFENRTGISTFDGSIEQALITGIEEASFITSFSRPGARTLAEQLKAGRVIDERVARLVSIREGIKVILTGSVERRDDRFEVAVRVVDLASQEQPPTFAATGGGVDQVLRAIPGLAAKVRTALGDRTPETEQLARAETFTTSSLEAVRSYTVAQELAYSEKDDQAIEHFRRATELDPNFGRAYAGWALSATHLGRRDEASELWKKALALLDRMSEREKYRTLGAYYSRVVRNHDKAIENYTTLLSLYPGDATGHGNLAVAYFRSLNFAKAFESGGRAIELMPSLRYRLNYVLYAMYAGDFASAAAEAARIIATDGNDAYAYLPIAVAALDKGDLAAARDAYSAMAKTGALGSSLANMGLADLALHQGFAAGAEKLLREGIVADRRNRNFDLVGAKLNAIAEARLADGRPAAAAEAAREAVQLGTDPHIAVPAARLFIAVGRAADAAAIAERLGSSLQPQARAYGQLIVGELALEKRQYFEAIDALRSGVKLADLWLLRFLTGIAYVEAGAYAEAISELELCEKRRGEAVAVFLDDVPSFRYLATLPYWLARAQEGVGLVAPAVANYTKYLDLGRDDATAADASRRLASLKTTAP